VNVFNADELELDVLVKILIFVPFASSPVSHGIYLEQKENLYLMESLLNLSTYLRPSVHDIHELGIRVRFQNAVEHLLIFQAASAEP
jgi:hypothetical protein